MKNCKLKPAPDDMVDKGIDCIMKTIEDILTDHLSIACRIGDLDHAQHIHELGNKCMCV